MKRLVEEDPMWDAIFLRLDTGTAKDDKSLPRASISQVHLSTADYRALHPGRSRSPSEATARSFYVCQAVVCGLWCSRSRQTFRAM